jgi:hypothetical protein
MMFLTSWEAKLERNADFFSTQICNHQVTPSFASRWNSAKLRAARDDDDTQMAVWAEFACL